MPKPLNLQSLAQQTVQDTQKIAGANIFSSFLNTDLDLENEGTGKDTIQMYIEVAAAALSSIAQWDEPAANTLMGVIDFLVSDARLKPYELDQQKQLAKESIDQVNQLQIKLQKLTQLNLQQNNIISQQKQQISQQQTQLVQQEFDITKNNNDIVQLTQEIKQNKEQISSQMYDQVDTRSNRDEAIRRQNQLMSQNIEFRSMHEQLLSDKKEYKMKLDKSLENERRLRQSLADAENISTEYQLLNTKLKKEIENITFTYQQQNESFQEEREALLSKMSQLNSDKQQLMTQNQVISDQMYKMQANYTQKQKMIDKLQDALTQAQNQVNGLNQKIAEINSQPRIEYKPVAKTDDFSQQVYGSVLRKEEYKYVEVLLDEETPYDQVLDAIDAELSATSIDKNIEEIKGEINERDTYNILLTKVQQRFVRKARMQQLETKYMQEQNKHQKYKSKYQSLISEVELQVLFSESKQLEQVNEDFETAMKAQNIESNPEIKKQMHKFRQSINNQQEKYTNEMEKLLSKVNVKDQKILEHCKKIQQKISMDEQGIEASNSIAQIVPAVGPVVAQMQSKLGRKQKILKQQQQKAQEQMGQEQVGNAMKIQVDAASMKNFKSIQVGYTQIQTDDSVQVDFLSNQEPMQIRNYYVQTEEPVNFENGAQTEIEMIDEETQIKFEELQILNIDTSSYKDLETTSARNSNTGLNQLKKMSTSPLSLKKSSKKSKSSLKDSIDTNDLTLQLSGRQSLQNCSLSKENMALHDFNCQVDFRYNPITQEYVEVCEEAVQNVPEQDEVSQQYEQYYTDAQMQTDALLFKDSSESETHNENIEISKLNSNQSIIENQTLINNSEIKVRKLKQLTNQQTQCEEELKTDLVETDVQATIDQEEKEIQTMPMQVQSPLRSQPAQRAPIPAAISLFSQDGFSRPGFFKGSAKQNSFQQNSFQQNNFQASMENLFSMTDQPMEEPQPLDQETNKDVTYNESEVQTDQQAPQLNERQTQEIIRLKDEVLRYQERVKEYQRNMQKLTDEIRDRDQKAQITAENKQTQTDSLKAKVVSYKYTQTVLSSVKITEIEQENANLSSLLASFHNENQVLDNQSSAFRLGDYTTLDLPENMVQVMKYDHDTSQKINQDKALNYLKKRSANSPLRQPPAQRRNSDITAVSATLSEAKNILQGILMTELSPELKQQKSPKVRATISPLRPLRPKTGTIKLIPMINSRGASPVFQTRERQHLLTQHSRRLKTMNASRDRQLDDQFIQDIIIENDEPKPMIIKVKKQKQSLQQTNTIESDDKKVVKYELVGGKFMSPFAEAIYQRQLKKQLKMNKQNEVGEAASLLGMLNPSLESQQPEIDNMQTFVEQNILKESMFYYMPNLFEDQPRIISSVEFDNFQKAKLVKRVDRFKLGFFLPKATLKNVQDGDKATNVKIGQQVTYAEILLDSKFKKMFEELGFNVVVSQTTMFVKTAANTSLKPVTWLLRTMRLFYYEMGQAKSSFTKLFLAWAKQKFANQLMLQKFLSVFYSNLVFHMQQDNIPSASAEIKMFYFLFESDADVDQILEFVNVRNYFKLEKQSPNTQTYEDMLKETVEPDPAAFVQQFVSQPKHQKIFAKFLQAKKATQHELVHVLLNIENQTRLKQTNQFIKAFNATGKQCLTCDEVIEILKKFYLFLSTPTLENIVAQYGLETFKLEPFLVIVKNLMSMKPQSDDLLVSAEKKYKICEQICQKLIEKETISTELLDRIEQIRNRYKYSISNRNGTQASWNTCQYYKLLFAQTNQE
ncbi:Conserved_hypothetical protein [Hexamita inflata]|uniref:Uncharacterized protein n=1 Tax=Hexamita inflata TaxID=28002 RepID=A0AA86P1V8_9EUKA|nr:Conserved hypothetical protein [Hexamita inflata]